MSKTIMIVEDDHHFHGLYAEMLEDFDYEIIHAYDGDEALEKLYEKRPDLIILDLKLSLINGDIFYQYIKNMCEFKDIPIIVVSNNYEFAYNDLIKIDSNLIFLDKALIGEKLVEEIKAKIG